MRKKVCIVTYSTIDNQMMEQTLTMPDHFYDPKYQVMLNNISTYVETKQWPDEPIDETIPSITWGLLPYQKIGTRCHSTQLHIPNETQHLYYRWILQMGVISTIIMKCFQNPDFEKMILKEASVRAKKKDETDVTVSHSPFYYSHGYRDALKRAKKRIQYHRNKEGSCDDEYFDLCRVIEEFELYTIHSIQICC